MQLRSYQQHEVDRAWVPSWAWFADPRMGKTIMGTHCIERWIREWNITRILITGPLEALNITWRKELAAIGCRRPSDEGDRLAHMIPLTEQAISKDKRVGRRKAERRHLPSRISILTDLCAGAAGSMPVVLLVNDEILGRPIRKATKTDRNPPKIADLILKWKPQALIGDESHRYQHASALRSAALRRISDSYDCMFTRLLSGTPDPKKAISFYHQFRILDPDVFGTSKRKFMNDWCYTAGRWNDQVVGYRNLPELFERVKARASIIKAEDYFDVPPVEEVPREVYFSEKVKSWYKKLCDDQALEVAELGVDVTTAHILTRLIRRAQFTSGFLPTGEDEEGDYVWLHDEKINAVVGDCSELLASGAKVVVSHRFVPEGPRLVEALRKRYGERTVLDLSRRTKDREAVVAPFSLDHNVESDARILVKSEKIGGQGISLARADHIIFPSWSFDYVDIEQSMKRIWHEEKKRMTVTFITIPNTVDAKALKNYHDKGDASIMARSYKSFGADIAA